MLLSVFEVTVAARRGQTVEEDRFFLAASGRMARGDTRTSSRL